MGSLEERRKTFDEVAELYDRVRPGYPESLIDDIVSLSDLPKSGRILEIGSGSGKGTLPFARRGHVITCVEPGSNLAAIARRRLAVFPSVRIEMSTFENWHSQDSDFDLVFAAQSFHFIDTALGIAKVADLLRVGGAFAVFGNTPLRGDAEVDRRVQEAYAAHAPGLGWHDAEALEDSIDASGRFGTVLMARYRWLTRYSADDYVALMQTQSDHHLLPAPRRTALLADIHAAIVAFGGSIEIDYETRLWIARRRS